MKSIENIKRYIASICAISQFFILFSIPSVAYSNNGITEDSSEARLLNESSSGTTETLNSPAGSNSLELIYSSDGSTNHNVHCACGYVVRTEAHSFTSIGGTTRCRFCSYVRIPGQIIMSKKEENLII